MSKYPKKILASIELFKRRKLRKFGSAFLTVLRQYASERPFEFPSFENDMAIGSIVRDKNYVSPPNKLNWVQKAMVNLKDTNSYSGDFLLQLELFKNGKLEKYGSQFLKTLGYYVAARPWEFHLFQNDPTVGQLIAVHFDPTKEGAFNWLRSKAKKEREVPVVVDEPEYEVTTPKPVAVVVPSDPFNEPMVIVEETDDDELEASTPTGESNTLVVVLAAAVAGYFIWQFLVPKN